MKYSAIYFDADDTLLDFKKSEEICFEYVLRKHNIDGDFLHYRRNYKKINDLLWTQEALGLITKDFLKVERFRKFLEEHSLTGNPDKICEDYLEALPNNVCLIEGTLDLLNALLGKIPMAIVTNGIGHVQHKRLNNANLTHYFKQVVVSEECGFSKPDQRIFELTMKKMELEKGNRVLMVGDKLETDILGANKFGIDSCWFNPEKLENKTEIKPTFEIHSLNEILEIIRS
jgi:2-haloacid dehalogenase